MTIIQERQWDHTGRALQELYGVAMTNFRSRQSPHDIQEEDFKKTKSKSLKGSWQEAMTEEMFYSRKVQNWIQACEQINGVRLMTEMREWKTAYQFALSALRATPFHPSLWKEIISPLFKKITLQAPDTARDKTPILLTPEQRL